MIINHKIVGLGRIQKGSVLRHLKIFSGTTYGKSVLNEVREAPYFTYLSRKV